MKNKILILIALYVLSGCVKKIEVAYPHSINEAQYKEFYDRYQFFITHDELKIFSGLQSDAERDSFINTFWTSHDPDPNTPENEFKEEIDKRIADIKEDVIGKNFENPEIIQFSHNGGMKGDLARVYLLHGTPDYAGFLSGRTFVTLMLWIYIDEAGHDKYRFLFYQKGGVANFILFKRQDPHFLMALAEISSRVGPGYQGLYLSPELLEIANEIMGLDRTGEFFISLAEFSYNSDVRIDAALQPPKSALITARENKSMVLGAPDIPKEDNMKESRYHATIPGEARIALDENNKIKVKILLEQNNVDWIIQEAEAETTLQLKVKFQEQNTKKWNSEVYEKEIKISIPRERLEKENSESLLLDTEELNDIINNTLKPGRYTVYLDIRNKISYKYGSWILEIIKN